MQQLSWTDDMMLRAETSATPLQIQMLLIYDPSTAPGGKVTFKGILEELDARLHLADVFRRRLIEVPGGFDRPYWVDDPSFDLEYHVRHIGLPQPGDWRQLCIQVARLHARQIDLRRPPWEITVIEGLNSIPGVPKGSFAMALKLHHCAVDGMASVQMIAAMHDLAADGPRPAAPDRPWQPAPLPTTANLLSHSMIKAALYPVRAGTVLASSAPKVVRGLAGLPGQLVRGVSRVAEAGAPSFPPTTRFNETVSPHRVFEARFHDLADFKRIKARVPGSTVNDVALAYVGGTLRRYLDGHGELPDDSLVAACPISLRDAGNSGGKGNMLFGRLQTLGTDIADPLERLAAIAASTAGSRSESDQSTRTQLVELIGTVPTSLLGVAAKAASVLPFSGPTVANTTVTNVPGPTEPIFFAGARLLRAAGLGPLIGGLNLIHVVASYNGILSIGATADRDALPDPATYAECMEHAFQDLLSCSS
ncbi:wax ester/triacylglycerol synthase family O-acyltransferase [Mycobacterium cookii]|uniref:Diacylglycerol O-acyltransferase n=1 Tax=Mycobacterium cookii TaxID=1775 RepID=A0A7I7KWB3_9MYCO|nr:wax ester/triacylglycerol synthase family O-acyltransferase [Mycobacterium cookii]MCV7332208.1 wax ester/triacylglycerol synthase family O-acyltransferase [Mycobacterium cookii]BBX46355.1 diacylglycerol O-acyltransferase [Mycobacterium cookii]